MDNLDQRLNALTAYVERENWKGYDPYDALNSPLFRFLSFGTKYGRIFFTQTLKRLPWNARPMFGIGKEWNAKGLGLFLRGYALRYANTRDVKWLERIDQICNLLRQLKSRQSSGNAWGYPFDWQSRAFYAPKDTPTIVNTSFIGHALLDAFEITRREELLELAVGIPAFILQDLNRTQESDAFCFSYTPLDHSCVHNANLLGASLLVRLNQYAPNTEWIQAAHEAIQFSLRRQQADGSWFYGEYPYQRWIDSFHTGFNLEALRHCLKAGFAGQYREAFEKGKTFYRENFFLADGTSCYYHDRTGALDIHSPAEAVIFFSGEGQEDRQFAEIILSWMFKRFYDSKGFFYFQNLRGYQVKIPYMRWAQAWAFLAISTHRFSYANETT